MTILSGDIGKSYRRALGGVEAGVAPTGAEVGWIRAGGWAGIVTAAVAWYTSAALVLAAMNNGRAIVPVGKGLWTGESFSFGQRRRLRQATAAR